MERSPADGDVGARFIESKRLKTNGCISADSIKLESLTPYCRVTAAKAKAKESFIANSDVVFALNV
jgi:hypothetical protein